MSARYVVRITPADVGRRVTVRARLRSGEHHASATDTVGTLLAWRGGLLRIERRDGTVREIAEGDLLAARVVPPPSPRDRD